MGSSHKATMKRTILAVFFAIVCVAIGSVIGWAFSTGNSANYFTLKHRGEAIDRQHHFQQRFISLGIKTYSFETNSKTCFRTNSGKTQEIIVFFGFRIFVLNKSNQLCLLTNFCKRVASIEITFPFSWSFVAIFLLS